MNRIIKIKFRLFYISFDICSIGENLESLTASKRYKEGVKKVGPGCKFYYRCIFDPVPNEDLKDRAKYGVELDPEDEQPE